jgi:hypothetical protein
MGRTACSAWLVLLGQFQQFWREALFAVHRRPRSSGVTAVQKFLVDTFVTTPAVSCCQFGRDRKPMMWHALLMLCWRMTIQAIDLFFGVLAQLVFVHYRVLLLVVALGALS